MPRPRKHDLAVAALRELMLAIESYRQTVAHTLGFGVTETQAMSNLMAAKSMGQTELAEALGITTSSVTSLIDRMEASGLVKRQPHARDRRRTVVQLTKFGVESVERTRTWFVHAFDEIDDARLEDVAELLSSLATNLRLGTERIPGRKRFGCRSGGLTGLGPPTKARPHRKPAAAILEGSASFHE